MAEENRSMEEIVESAVSASQSGSGHRPIGPFGPIPKNSQMEADRHFRATPIVHGEMPRHQSNTSAASAAYHTVQGSESERSQSVGYQTTRGDDSDDPGDVADTEEEEEEVLLPSKLTNPFKSYAYWSRTSLGNSDGSAARTSASEHRGRVLPTSGESSRSEPRVMPSSRSRVPKPSPRGSRDFEIAEAMTYEERQRAARGSSSGSSRYRNIDGASSVGGGASGGRSSSPGRNNPAERKFPFQVTESGASLKVEPKMIAYQDKNMAILVADPKRTRLRVKAREKKAKSAGSETDRMSAEIHASYDNLSATGGKREIREVSGFCGSQRGSQHNARQEVFYETSEHEERHEWSAAEGGHTNTSHWEEGSSPRELQTDENMRGSQLSVLQGGGGSARGSVQRETVRSQGGGSVRAKSHRSTVSGKRGSGTEALYDPCIGVNGNSRGSQRVGSSSSSSKASVFGGEGVSKSRGSHQSQSPRSAASQRFEATQENTTNMVQRAMRPADNDGEFTTHFNKEQSTGTGRAAFYSNKTTVSRREADEFVTSKAPEQGQGGYYQSSLSTDGAGYPRRASGDWRRRASTVTMIEDEVCDLEEKEEIFSGPVKDKLSRPDADNGGTSGGGRKSGDQRYNASSGGRSGQKRELGLLTEEAARSASEEDCYIDVDGAEVPCSSWAVRRYSRYLQNLGNTLPRHISLPESSATVTAVSTAIRWCYESPEVAAHMVTRGNCADLYEAARALDIPELMDQCKDICCGEQNDYARSGGSPALPHAVAPDRWDRVHQARDTSDGYARDTNDAEQLYSRQSRRRQSSYGSASPMRPYVRMYTDDEVEAATKIQAGYRGFRARQELKKYGPGMAGRSRSRRLSHPTTLAPRDSEYAPPVPREYNAGASVHLRAQAELREEEDVDFRPRTVVSQPQNYRSDAAHRFQEEVQHKLQAEMTGKSEAKIRHRSQTNLSERSLSNLSQKSHTSALQTVTSVAPSEKAEASSSSGQWRASRASIVQQPQPYIEPRSPAGERSRSRSQSPGRSQVSFSMAGGSGGGTARSRANSGVASSGSGGGSRTNVRRSSLSRPSSRSSGSGSRRGSTRRGSGDGYASREAQAALVIQRNYRSYSARVHYEEKRYAAATIQRFIRGHLAREQVNQMKEAATKIQNCFREHLNAKRAAIDPAVQDGHGLHTTISSSSDWKCRALLHPEGGTILVMAGLNPMKDYCAKYNSGCDMYRYQAFQNAWEYVGQVPEPRHHASLAYLRGLVYLIGGTDPRYKAAGSGCRALATVWILDPTTGNWWIGPPMKHARIHHGTVVAQGQLYIIGGQDADGQALTSVEVYDPDADSWREMAPIGCGRLGVAVAVHHHRIWVVGGMCPAKKCDVVCTVDIYDTIRKRWCQGPPLRHPRCFARLLVSAQRLFVVGGAGRTTRHQKCISSLDTIERFEEEQRAWVHVAQMKTTRHGHACVPGNEQEFLILGGVSSQNVAALDLVEEYNARTNNWVRGVAKLPSPLSGLAAVTIPQKKPR